MCLYVYEQKMEFHLVYGETIGVGNMNFFVLNFIQSREQYKKVHTFHKTILKNILILLNGILMENWNFYKKKIFFRTVFL